MEQQQIFDALDAYLLYEDIQPWRAVLDGLKSGEVILVRSTNQVIIKAVSHPARTNFAGRLSALQKQSGLTYQQLADEIGMSQSVVLRYCTGGAVGTWPTIFMLISLMGGDPADYRKDFLAIEAERRNTRKP